MMSQAQTQQTTVTSDRDLSTQQDHEDHQEHGAEDAADSSNPQQHINHEVLNEITEYIDTLVHLSQSDDILREYCMKFQLEHAAANAAYTLELENYGKKRITPPAGLAESHMKGALERMADFCGSVSRRVLARTLELSANANNAKLMGVSPGSMSSSSIPEGTAGVRACSPMEPFNSDSMPNTNNLNFIVAGGIEQYPEGSQNPYNHSLSSDHSVGSSSHSNKQAQQPASQGHFPTTSSMDQPSLSNNSMPNRSSSVEDVAEGTLAWIEVGANAMHAAVNGLNLLGRAHAKLGKKIKSHMLNPNGNVKVLEYVSDALSISREVEMHCFAEGYRTLHVSLLANLTHDCPEICKAAGGSPKVLSAILTCTRLDEENPGCAEWAEYTIRNICLHSPEARDFIKHLKLSVKSPGAALAASSASGASTQQQQSQLEKLREASAASHASQ